MGCFKWTSRNEESEGMRIFGSRFIDEIKRAEQGIQRKNRLVAQNCNDDGSMRIATKAPTVQGFYQRLLIALESSVGNVKLFTRVITQAYVQRHTNLERKVFLQPDT